MVVHSDDRVVPAGSRRVGWSQKGHDSGPGSLTLPLNPYHSTLGTGDVRCSTPRVSVQTSIETIF